MAIYDIEDRFMGAQDLDGKCAGRAEDAIVMRSISDH